MEDVLCHVVSVCIWFLSDIMKCNAQWCVFALWVALCSFQIIYGLVGYISESVASVRVCVCVEVLNETPQ